MTIWNKISAFLSGARLLHFTLPILMAYIVIGTVSQKYIGLYQATQIFFSNPVIWVYDAFPFPGMPIIVAMIFFNLTFKLIFKSPFHPKKIGIMLTHIGALLLLVGGLFTALFSSEGYIALAEGESSNIVSDYHFREFVVMDKNGKVITKLDHKNMLSGQIINDEALPFTIKIEEYCVNCNITARENKTDDYQGMAMHMQLSAAPIKNNDEENMAGLTYSVYDADQKAIFVSIEDVPKYPSFTVNDKEYSFALRREQRAIPFTIELLDFEKESHPGTQMAKSYQSTVLVKDGDLQWESVISMNAPLRYKGYTFFQSSFTQTPKGEISVFAVVWNVGRSFPYISGIVMCLGLILHLFLRTPKTKAKKLALILLALGLTPLPSHAQEAPNLDTHLLGQLPILHEGRVKPIDSFARALRKELSGTENSAMPWLIDVLFDPARAQDRPTLKITNPDILTLLNLDKSPNKLYSYNQVSAGLAQKQERVIAILQVDENEWTAPQRDLIQIQRNLVTLQTLMATLTPFLPLNIILPETVEKPFTHLAAKPINFVDTITLQDDLQQTLKSIMAQKGDDIESYTNEEQALLQLSYTLSMLQETGNGKALFNAFWSEGTWRAPWSMINANLSSDIFQKWSALGKAYHQGDADQWNKAAAALHDAPLPPSIRGNALRVEYIYNQYNPFYISFLIGLGAVGALLLSLFCYGQNLPRQIVLPLLTSGLLCQVAGIAARIYILERAPVSTLYETVLFVSCVMTIYALISYVRQRKTLWLWLCACLGIFLQILGFSHNQDGDSFVMLSAVLNTNFWLTTHVLCITAGYAFCAITSLLAHYALVLMARGKDFAPQNDLFKNIHTAALISLFFAGIGTVLGGIWADQSWGRFWGWDPKENGAMLIVLWLIWSLHGRISGQLRMTGFLCALSYTSVILALSWFGVNILSVGLHAYGFTDSAAWILGAFIAIETTFIALIAFSIHQQQKQAANV